MSTEPDFFATRAAPAETTPAPHELRVEFLRPPVRQAHWRATVTTLGPWIKVPLTLFLVFYQLIRIVHAVRTGGFPGGPALAFELTEVFVWYSVVALLLKAIWAGGKPDRRRIDG